MINYKDEMFCCSLFAKARENDWIIIYKMTDSSSGTFLSYAFCVIVPIYEDKDKPHTHGWIEIVYCPWCKKKVSTIGDANLDD